MTHSLRPLSLGQLLDETFNIYRRNFLLFAGISAVPNIALLVFELSLAGPTLQGAKPSSVAALLIGLASYVTSLFVTSLVTAATALGVSDIYLDTPTCIRACFSRVAGKALRVFYVSFVVSLIVAFGTMLCIVPGIYWSGVYGVAMPAVVLEDIAGNQSLKRSSYLTQDSVGRVVVVYFLTTIFTAGMVWALSAGIPALSGTGFHGVGMLTKEMLQEILTTLCGILFGPVTAIALTLVYYDQRVRKEAFDIEHMMRMMAASQNLGSGAPAA